MAKFIRYQRNGAIGYGQLDGEIVRELSGDFLDAGSEYTGRRWPLSEVKLLAPVAPPNVLCIGLNYRSHASEAEMKLPAQPLIFLKTTTAVCGPGEDILLPKMAPDHVDYEGELTVVIGKTARYVPQEEALDYVFGYTIANDVSARDCQLKIDSQWARGKSFDSFCPVGPVVATGLDPTHLAISTRLNGRVMQDSNTERMIFDVAKLVSYCSSCMTLLPGTIILTGTPEGVGFTRDPAVFLRPGDVVRIDIEGIGSLENAVTNA